MRQVSDTIPAELASRVDAAVAWFNNSAESAGVTFKATGILDADETLQGSDELQLILCGADRCEQHSFRVTGLRRTRNSGSNSIRWGLGLCHHKRAAAFSGSGARALGSQFRECW